MHKSTLRLIGAALARIGVLWCVLAAGIVYMRHQDRLNRAAIISEQKELIEATDEAIRVLEKEYDAEQKANEERFQKRMGAIRKLQEEPNPPPSVWDSRPPP